MDGEDKTGGRMRDVVRGFTAFGHLLPRTRYIVAYHEGVPNLIHLARTGYGWLYTPATGASSVG
jgi:hypothetical protein